MIPAPAPCLRVYTASHPTEKCYFKLLGYYGTYFENSQLNEWNFLLRGGTLCFDRSLLMFRSVGTVSIFRRLMSEPSKKAKTASFQILSKLLFVSYQSIRHHVLF
jgi:hypothetical protein